MENKIIKVIGNSSVFTEYLGRYGVILEKAYGDKWLVEFKGATETQGRLIHTLNEEDFEVIGSVSKKNSSASEEMINFMIALNYSCVKSGVTQEQGITFVYAMMEMVELT